MTRLVGCLLRLLLFLVLLCVVMAMPPLLFFFFSWMAFTRYFLRKDK
jgi:hypothetical protein